MIHVNVCSKRAMAHAVLYLCSERAMTQMMVCLLWHMNPPPSSPRSSARRNPRCRLGRLRAFLSSRFCCPPRALRRVAAPFSTAPFSTLLFLLLLRRLASLPSCPRCPLPAASAAARTARTAQVRRSIVTPIRAFPYSRCSHPASVVAEQTCAAHVASACRERQPVHYQGAHRRPARSAGGQYLQCSW